MNLNESVIGARDRCGLRDPGCSNDKLNLFALTKSLERISDYWLCPNCVQRIKDAKWWKLTKLEVFYHYCNPLCLKCMENPRDVVRF